MHLLTPINYSEGSFFKGILKLVNLCPKSWLRRSLWDSAVQQARGLAGSAPWIALPLLGGLCRGLAWEKALPSPSLLRLKSRYEWPGSPFCCSEGWGSVVMFWLLGLVLEGSTRLGVACFRGARGGLSGTKGALPTLSTFSFLVGPRARPFLFFSLPSPSSLGPGLPWGLWLPASLGALEKPLAGVRVRGLSGVGFWPRQLSLAGVVAVSLWSCPLAGWGWLPPAVLVLCCWPPWPPLLGPGLVLRAVGFCLSSVP